MVYEWKGFLQMTDEKMIVEHNFHVTLENFIKSLWFFFVLWSTYECNFKQSYVIRVWITCAITLVSLHFTVNTQRLVKSRPRWYSCGLSFWNDPQKLQMHLSQIEIQSEKVLLVSLCCSHKKITLRSKSFLR